MNKLLELYPRQAGKISAALNEGYSDEEILEFLRQKEEEALNEGYTQEEVRKFLGRPSPKEELKVRAQAPFTALREGIETAQGKLHEFLSKPEVQQHLEKNALAQIGRIFSQIPSNRITLEILSRLLEQAAGQEPGTSGLREPFSAKQQTALLEMVPGFVTFFPHVAAILGERALEEERPYGPRGTFKKPPALAEVLGVDYTRPDWIKEALKGYAGAMSEHPLATGVLSALLGSQALGGIAKLGKKVLPGKAPPEPGIVFTEGPKPTAEEFVRQGIDLDRQPAYKRWQPKEKTILNDPTPQTVTALVKTERAVQTMRAAQALQESLPEGPKLLPPAPPVPLLGRSSGPTSPFPGFLARILEPRPQEAPFPIEDLIRREVKVRPKQKLLQATPEVVLYHGGSRRLGEPFIPELMNERTQHYGRGVYFFDNPEHAMDYARSRTRQVSSQIVRGKFLDLESLEAKNILGIGRTKNLSRAIKNAFQKNPDLRDEIVKKGYVGVKYPAQWEAGYGDVKGKSYAVYDLSAVPTQKLSEVPTKVLVDKLIEYMAGSSRMKPYEDSIYGRKYYDELKRRYMEKGKLEEAPPELIKEFQLDLRQEGAQQLTRVPPKQPRMTHEDALEYARRLEEENRYLKKAIKRVQYIDPQTELLSKSGERALTTRAISVLKRLKEEKHLTQFAIDLHGFKRVNTEAGYEAGDAVIARTAEALKKIGAGQTEVPVRGFVSHKQGDEFTLTARLTPEQAQKVLPAIKAELDKQIAELADLKGYPKTSADIGFHTIRIAKDRSASSLADELIRGAQKKVSEEQKTVYEMTGEVRRGSEQPTEEQARPPSVTKEPKKAKKPEPVKKKEPEAEQEYSNIQRIFDKANLEIERARNPNVMKLDEHLDYYFDKIAEAERELENLENKLKRATAVPGKTKEKKIKELKDAIYDKQQELEKNFERQYIALRVLKDGIDDLPNENIKLLKLSFLTDVPGNAAFSGRIRDVGFNAIEALKTKIADEYIGSRYPGTDESTAYRISQSLYNRLKYVYQHNEDAPADIYRVLDDYLSERGTANSIFSSALDLGFRTKSFPFEIWQEKYLKEYHAGPPSPVRLKEAVEKAERETQEFKEKAKAEQEALERQLEEKERQKTLKQLQEVKGILDAMQAATPQMRKKIFEESEERFISAGLSPSKILLPFEDIGVFKSRVPKTISKLADIAISSSKSPLGGLSAGEIEGLYEGIRNGYLGNPYYFMTLLPDEVNALKAKLPEASPEAGKSPSHLLKTCESITKSIRENKLKAEKTKEPPLGFSLDFYKSSKEPRVVLETESGKEIVLNKVYYDVMRQFAPNGKIMVATGEKPMVFAQDPKTGRLVVTAPMRETGPFQRLADIAKKLLTEEKGQITFHRKTDFEKKMAKRFEKMRKEERDVLTDVTWNASKRMKPTSGARLQQAVLSGAENPKEAKRSRGEILIDELFTPVDHSPNSQAAHAYFRSGNFKDYVDAMPDLGELKPGEVKKAPGVVDVRESGQYVHTSFLKQFIHTEKGKQSHVIAKDIARNLRETMDIARIIERIDQGRIGGAAARFILWPARDTIRARLLYEYQKKMKVSDLAEKYRIRSKQDEVLAWHLLNGDQIQAPPRVKAFAEEMRKVFDELLEEQNAAREKRKQDLIPKRKDYVTWAVRNHWMDRLLGMRTKPKDILDAPTVPDYIQPNKPFNPRELPREANYERYIKEMRVLKLASDYIGTAAKDIFNTNIIHNNKIHAKFLKDIGLGNASDAIMAWTTEVFAGLPHSFDRFVSRLGAAVNVPMALQARLRTGLMRSIFPLNFTWNLLTQTNANIMLLPKVGLKNALLAIPYSMKPSVKKLIEQTYTHYMKSASNPEIAAFKQTMKKFEILDKPPLLEKISDRLNFLTTAIEKWSTDHAIAAGLLHGKQLGLTGRRLFEYAGEVGARTQSMYNLEDLPGILRSKNIKASFPLQTFAFEAMNNVRDILSASGSYSGITGGQKIAKLLKLEAGIIAANAISDACLGRDSWSLLSFIPFGAPIAALFDLQVEGTRYGAYKPILVQFFDQMRKAVRDAVYYDDWRSARKLVLQYVPAGTPIERTIEGYEAAKRGGMYDAAGRRIYRVKPSEKLQAMLRGPGFTETAKKEKEKKEPTVLQKILGGKNERKHWVPLQ